MKCSVCHHEVAPPSRYCTLCGNPQNNIEKKQAITTKKALGPKETSPIPSDDELEYRFEAHKKTRPFTETKTMTLVAHSSVQTRKIQPLVDDLMQTFTLSEEDMIVDKEIKSIVDPSFRKTQLYPSERRLKRQPNISEHTSKQSVLSTHPKPNDSLNNSLVLTPEHRQHSNKQKTADPGKHQTEPHDEKVPFKTQSLSYAQMNVASIETEPYECLPQHMKILSENNKKTTQSIKQENNTFNTLRLKPSSPHSDHETSSQDFLLNNQKKAYPNHQKALDEKKNIFQGKQHSKKNNFLVHPMSTHHPTSLEKNSAENDLNVTQRSQQIPKQYLTDIRKENPSPKRYSFVNAEQFIERIAMVMLGMCLTFLLVYYEWLPPHKKKGVSPDLTQKILSSHTLSSLKIQTVPSGATVFLNQHKYPTKTPLFLEIKPGQYEIELFLKGHQRKKRNLNLRKGHTVDIEIFLPTLEKP